MKNFLIIASLLSVSAFANTKPHKKEMTEMAAPVPEGTLPAVTQLNGCDVFLTGEFIYWKARQDGLDFAENGKGFLTTGGLPATFGKGTTKDINFKYKPGFKVGLGLDFKHDGWDVYANYTWLRNTNNKATSFTQRAATGAMTSNWLVPVELSGFSEVVPAPIVSASGNWRFHFNVLDVELGRNSNFSRSVALRPHVGFKGAWINQRYGVDYQIFTSPVAGVTPIGFIDLNMKQNYSGYGICVGSNFAWEFAKHWDIFCDFGISALWSSFHDKRTDTDTVSTVLGGTPFTTYNVKRRFSTIRPVLEMDAGFRFSYEFTPHKSRIDFQAGWEEQIWFNHNQYANAGSLRYGDLNFQGLTVKLAYLF